MNKNTKIIIGVGAAAVLLFFFRKQIFGGGNGDENGTETESEFVEDFDGAIVKKRTEDKPTVETVEREFVFPTTPDTRTPDYSNVPSRTTTNTTTASPGGSLTPRVDTNVFFSAPSATALGGM